MRGAVFHDYFSTIGGGEKTALSIADCLDADIITTSVDIPMIYFNNINIISIGRAPEIPGVRQTYATWKFKRSKLLQDYDYAIFSGNWAHHAASTEIPSIYYCQDAPVRALYDLYNQFLTHQPYTVKPFFMVWAKMMKVLDQRAINRISTVVANSQSVHNRVMKYYHRPSPIIYPPVETNKYMCKEYGDFWLSVNRLYPEKRIELQIRAFANMPDRKLIIIGGYSFGDHAAPYSRKIIKEAEQYPNIKIISEGISDKDLKDLYARCIGVICTSKEESFGIVPVEAMASGKPVIAVEEGGFIESISRDCGTFIKPTIGDLQKAVEEVSLNPENYKENCIKQSKKFDISIFSREIKNNVSKILKT